MTKTKWLICALVILMVGGAGAQSLTVPQLVNYQGRLTDSSGAPLATAEYDLSFSIFDGDGSAGNEGNRVWGPKAYANVPVVQGHFNVLLGPTDDDPTPRSIAYAFSGPDRYLEVTLVGTGPGGEDEVVSPRQAVLSTPYAFQALGSVPVGGIISYLSIGGALPDNWRECDGAQVNDPESPLNGATLPDLRDQFLVGAGLNYSQLDQGGAETHTHDPGDLFISGVSDTSPIIWWNATPTGPQGSSGRVVLGALRQDPNGAPSGPSQSHGHFPGSFNGNTGSASSLPPYVAVKFIMRIK